MNIVETIAEFTSHCYVGGMHINANRTLVLADIENIHGGTDFTVEDVCLTRRLITSAAALPRDAHVVVAASSGQGLVTAGLGWPDARRVWLAGHDGADLALADVALNEDVVVRFNKVVICSGDGLFAVVARYLQVAGLEVVVVSRPKSLSRALADAAENVVLLRASGRAA